MADDEATAPAAPDHSALNDEVAVAEPAVPADDAPNDEVAAAEPAAPDTNPVVDVRFLKLMSDGKQDAMRKRRATAFRQPVVKWRPTSEYSCEQLEWMVGRLAPGGSLAPKPKRQDPWLQKMSQMSHGLTMAVTVLEQQLGTREHDVELGRAISHWKNVEEETKAAQQVTSARCVSLLSELNDGDCAICLTKLSEKPPPPPPDPDDELGLADMISPPCSPSSYFESGQKIAYPTSCRHTFHHECFTRWMEKQQAEIENTELETEPEIKMKVTLKPLRCCVCQSVIVDTSPASESGIDALFNLC